MTTSAVQKPETIPADTHNPETIKAVLADKYIYNYKWSELIDKYHIPRTSLHRLLNSPAALQIAAGLELTKLNTKLKLNALDTINRARAHLTDNKLKKATATELYNIESKATSTLRLVTDQSTENIAHRHSVSIDNLADILAG